MSETHDSDFKAVLRNARFMTLFEDDTTIDAQTWAEAREGAAKAGLCVKLFMVAYTPFFHAAGSA